MKKDRKNKEKSKARKNIWSTIAFIVFLAIPGILYAIFQKYDMACMICSYVFLLTPVFMGLLINDAKKSKKYTDEQLKNGRKRIGALIWYYWLLDLVVLSLIERWFWLSLIFGGIAITINLYDIGSALVNTSFNNKFMDVLMIFEFISSISLTAYLIYTIPNEDFRNVLVPIIAASIGGLITLTGVYLTIKKSDRDRKNDEIARAKPCFFVVDRESRFNKNIVPTKIILNCENHDSFKKASENDHAYSLREITIINSNLSDSIFCGIKINDSIQLYDVPHIINKDANIIMKDYCRYIIEEDIKKVALLIKDVLYNPYEMEVSFLIEEYGIDKEIKMTGITSIKKSSF